MQKLYYRTQAHIALIVAHLIYGLNFSIAKFVMPGYLRPLALLTLRSSVTALLFWISSLFIPKEKVSRKDLLYIFLISFLGVVINQMFFLIGLNLTTPVNSSIILSIVPVAAFVFAALILKEKIYLLRAVGLVTGLGGIMLLILEHGTPDFGSSTFLGNLYTLINSISWALFTVLIKRMLEKYHPVTVMKWVFLFGMIINVPAGLGDLSTTNWNNITMNGWLEIGFVVVMSTFVGYLLLTFGLRRLSPTIVNTYTYTQPVIAGIVATLMGQDNVTFIKLLSTVLIFMGVFLVSRRQRTELENGSSM
jgi:drug/metabolite transporter (DMT)-like permease